MCFRFVAQPEYCCTFVEIMNEPFLRFLLSLHISNFFLIGFFMQINT